MSPPEGRGGDEPVEGLASRVAAYRALRRVHAGGAWAGRAVDAALRRAGLDARDRAFAANLAFSTLRWEGTLDWALGQVLSRPLHEVDPEVVDVLRLGAWQLLQGDVPDRAAVTTAVELARAEVGARATGFVNGVLRALARQAGRLPWPDAASDEGQGLRCGYPAWVVAEARRRFGGRAPAVLAAGNEPPGVTLRAVTDREAVASELRAAGLHPEPGRYAPEALRLGPADPGGLPAVVQGRAVVQDEASMVVARAACAGRTGAWWALDVCAAPGGKATHLAQLGRSHGRGVAVAADVRLSRARLVVAAAARAGLPVGVVVADGTRPPWPPRLFDVVLVDAPCTGLGVVRRRPELRWRREPGDVERLAALQLALLRAAAPLVRPAGTLLYSVCTWTLAETEGVAAAFLDAAGDRFAADDTPAVAGVDGDGPGLQLDPDRDGTDGMFLARFARRS